eukprot:6478048-Amphidinium_carterae.1
MTGSRSKLHTLCACKCHAEVPVCRIYRFICFSFKATTCDLFPADQKAANCIASQRWGECRFSWWPDERADD